jgi:hypothetical protein
MRNYPTVTPDAQLVLRIMLDHGVIPGADLMRRYAAQKPNTPPATLLAAIYELKDKGLIEVGGEVSADTLPFATFGIRPSAKEYLSWLISPR